METTYDRTFVKQPRRFHALHTPTSLWIKRHPLVGGALAVVVFPVLSLGALAICTLALTLPIGFLMGLI